MFTANLKHHLIPNLKHLLDNRHGLFIVLFLRAQISLIDLSHLSTSKVNTRTFDGDYVKTFVLCNRWLVTVCRTENKALGIMLLKLDIASVET